MRGSIPVLIRPRAWAEIHSIASTYSDADIPISIYIFYESKSLLSIVRGRHGFYYTNRRKRIRHFGNAFNDEYLPTLSTVLLHLADFRRIDPK